MIIFSWTLTPNQVLALRSVADFQRRYEEAAAQKKFLDLTDNSLDQYNLKHWIGATRHLFKEGFIVHKEVPWESWQKKYAHSRMRQAWEITTKGLLVLQLVEIEVHQQANILKIDKKELRVLQKAVGS